MYSSNGQYIANQKISISESLKHIKTLIISQKTQQIVFIHWLVVAFLVLMMIVLCHKWQYGIQIIILSKNFLFLWYFMFFIGSNFALWSRVRTCVHYVLTSVWTLCHSKCLKDSVTKFWIITFLSDPSVLKNVLLFIYLFYHVHSLLSPYIYQILCIYSYSHGVLWAFKNSGQN